MSISRFQFATWIALAVATAGCAHESLHPSHASIQTTSVSQPSAPKGDVAVSNDIAKACNIDFANADRAPKFDTNDSGLQPADRSVLGQVASCVTTGPLKGRSLKLVGRADPRGETEYNFVLGEHRAGTVDQYLVSLGVSKSKLVETSRGKLDATGNDESSWQRDRRVDIMLQ